MREGMEMGREPNMLETTAASWAKDLGRLAGVQFGKFAKGKITIEDVRREVAGDLEKMIVELQRLKEGDKTEDLEVQQTEDLEEIS